MAGLLAAAVLFASPPGDVTGGITFYYGGDFEGHTLHCGYPDLVYDCKNMEPWGAFPLEWFQSGRYQCWDRVKITFSDRSEMWVYALDACPGCLKSEVWDTGKPFVADLPRCWRNGQPTATGSVFNYDEWLRSIQKQRKKRWL